MMKRIIKVILLSVLLMESATVLSSCTKDPIGTGSFVKKEKFDGCTAIYKGTSESFEAKKEGLTLYSTEVENEFFIPYFFNGAPGELNFTWDKESNKLQLIESCTGLSYYDYPVFVLSQNRYLAEMGDKAKESTFDPVTRTFTFNVLLEMSNGIGGSFTSPAVMSFTITENL